MGEGVVGNAGQRWGTCNGRMVEVWEELVGIEEWLAGDRTAMSV